MNDKLRSLAPTRITLRRSAASMWRTGRLTQLLFVVTALAAVISLLGGYAAARRGQFNQRWFSHAASSAVPAPAALSVAAAPVLTLAQGTCTDNLGPSLSNCVPGTGTCPNPYPDVNAVGMLNGRDNAYNVFIGGNLTIGGGAAEMEGKIFVYGNMTLNKTNNGTYNMGYAGVGTGVLPDALTDWVTVGGNISVPSHNGTTDGTRFIIGGTSLGAQDIRGRLRYKGTLTPPLDGTFPDPIDVPNNSQVINDPGLNLAPFDATFATLATKSSCWGALTSSTNGQFLVDSAPDQYRFRSTNGAGGLYVFNVTVDLDRGFQVPIVFENFPDTATILINLNKAGTGDTITINANDVLGLSDVLRERILWNFPDATTVNFIGNAPFYGSVLIPSRMSTANVSMSGMNGRFIVGGNLNHTGGGAEFHNYPFRGELPCCGGGTVSCTVIGAASVCTGTTNSYTVMTTPATLTNPTYSWSLSNAGGATAAITGATTNPTVGVNAGTTGGSYLLSVNITSAEGNTTCSTTATINLAPLATIMAPTAVCAGTIGNTASVPSAGANATYVWTITSGTITGGQGTNAITWTAGTAGTAMLGVTVTNAASCTTVGSQNVTINPNPTAIAGPDQSLCQASEGPTAFTLNGTVSGGTTQWAPIASTGTASAMIVAPTNASTIVNVSGLGTVTLQLTVTSNTTPSCGAATDTVVLTVTQGAVASAGNDQTLCQTVPGPTVFSVTGSGGTPSWEVFAATGGASAIIVSPNSATTNVNVTGTGTITLRLTTMSTCGTATDDVVLTVNPNPTASAGDNQTLCQTVPGPTAFSVTGTFTGGTPAAPAWTVFATTGSAGAIITSPNAATTAVNVTGTGSVTLRFTVNSNATPSCGAATDDVVLTVNPAPTATAGADQTRCQDASGTTLFSVMGTASGGTPQWMVQGTTGTAAAIIAAPNNATTGVSVTGTGTVTLRLTTTSNTTPACGAASDELVLTVNPLPVATITATPTVCANAPGNLALVPDAGVGAGYNWTITNGTITSGQGTPSITYTAGAVGTTGLSVAVTSSANCSASATLSVNTVLCDLSLTKSVDRPLAKVTEIVTFTISVRNNGALSAANVVVNDLLPSGYVFVSATGSQGSYNQDTGIWTVGTLAGGATATLQIRAAVNASGPYLNSASVASEQFDSVPGNNQGSASVQPVVPYGPGEPYPPSSEVSDQKAGSVLIFPSYSSSASAPGAQNTRLCLTNIEPMNVSVHLFFVDGATCSVADAYVNLTGNQTACFQTSDLDPGTTGYLVAVAVGEDGCPINFNCLIGDAYLKLSSGHQANLGAEGFAAQVGATFDCDANATTATLRFDGVMYNRAPRVLAASGVPSRVDGNDTLLTLMRVGGNLATGAATLGPISGLFYNDAEVGLSFTFNAGACKFVSSLSNNFPRLTPRFEQFVPAGRTGWLKLWTAGEFGILGTLLNYNPNTASSPGAFNGGHNLHKLTLTAAASYEIPIFPPGR